MGIEILYTRGDEIHIKGVYGTKYIKPPIYVRCILVPFVSSRTKLLHKQHEGAMLKVKTFLTV